MQRAQRLVRLVPGLLEGAAPVNTHRETLYANASQATLLSLYIIERDEPLCPEDWQLINAPRLHHELGLATHESLSDGLKSLGASSRPGALPFLSLGVELAFLGMGAAAGAVGQVDALRNLRDALELLAEACS
jgi:hypothetical protein